MNRKCLFFMCASSMLVLTIYFLYESIRIPTTKRIVQISVPKAGTNLLQKCIELLTNKKPITVLTPGREKKSSCYAVPNDFDKLAQLPQSLFWVVHLMYKPEYEQLLSSKNYAPIIIYRDPRDQIISSAYYMKKNDHKWTRVTDVSVEDVISDLITVDSRLGYYPSPTRNIVDFYNAYKPWVEMPGCLVIRFEDLVGAKGGGSDERQLTAIQSIARHIGLSINDKQAKWCATMMFGDTVTFRTGQIGSWKKHFTQEQKDIFKKVAGNLLIELGYEKDLDW